MAGTSTEKNKYCTIFRHDNDDCFKACSPRGTGFLNCHNVTCIGFLHLSVNIIKVAPEKVYEGPFRIN